MQNVEMNTRLSDRVNMGLNESAWVVVYTDKETGAIKAKLGIEKIATAREVLLQLGLVDKLPLLEQGAQYLVERAHNETVNPALNR